MSNPPNTFLGMSMLLKLTVTGFALYDNQALLHYLSGGLSYECTFVRKAEVLGLFMPYYSMLRKACKSFAKLPEKMPLRSYCYQE